MRSRWRQVANKWQIGGIQRETKGNRRREKEAKFDFITKKCALRLRMCEKSSTSRAPTSPLKRARPPRNYVREMQPILQTLTPFLKIWLCHFIEPSPIHSLVSKLPASAQVIAQMIDKIYLFSKKVFVFLRMCIFCSNFAAKCVVSPIWQAKVHRKTAEKHVLKLKIKN